MASISCQHIYKIYPGATAPSVTDFNLEIQDKEFIIFVGPSGCGKSTTPMWSRKMTTGHHRWRCIRIVRDCIAACPRFCGGQCV